MGNTITEKEIDDFRSYLLEQEKEPSTTYVYVHAVRNLSNFIGINPLSHGILKEFRESLIESDYKPATINAFMAGINAFLAFAHNDLGKTKHLKIQTSPYRDPRLDLTGNEIQRLEIAAAKKNTKASLLLASLKGTGIRVSEVRHITVEALTSIGIKIHNKGKSREIIIPSKLRKKLLAYADSMGIASGPIFRTKTGKPLDRAFIWRLLKSLAKEAGIPKEKVFPHNFRRYFAKRFYSCTKDISRLADLLGHSNISTTRIYIMETSAHIQKLVDFIDGLDVSEKSGDQLRKYGEWTNNPYRAEFL